MRPKLAIALVLAVCLPRLWGAEPRWRLAIEEDFDSPKCLEQWSLDGLAHVSVTPRGKLRIVTKAGDVNGKTARCSVLWHRSPVWGDVRIEFDAKAAPKTRALLFFNARANTADRSIFAWKRPLAAYADYAYEPRIELYTLGMLRSDQRELNFRHLGGDVKREWIEAMPHHPYRFPERWLSKAELAGCLANAGLEALPTDLAQRRAVLRKPAFRQALAPHIARWKQINDDFQKASILASCVTPEPIFADAAKWHHVWVEARGAHVKVRFDGKTAFDFVDKQRAQSPLAGGYFGFRNFRPTETQFDNLRVYRLTP